MAVSTVARAQESARAVDIAVAREVEQRDVGLVPKQFLDGFAQLGSRHGTILARRHKQLGLSEVRGPVGVPVQDPLDIVRVIGCSVQRYYRLVVVDPHDECLTHSSERVDEIRHVSVGPFDGLDARQRSPVIGVDPDASDLLPLLLGALDLPLLTR